MDLWDRAHNLFLAAADLAPVELAPFLDTACREDPELRAEVESLLISDRKNGASIAAAVEMEACLLFESTFPGERLGSYRIVREIGRGGMGVVYLATRDDDQYRKQVAIKVVKRGMDTAEVLSRFRYERQILADLDHPYIARLHDGGTTPDGRPFFVMEYVEGQALDEFCRQRALSTADRCHLFLRVCEAVAHAHRNLVVHRDLKPANIFVTPEGNPKLLDFGIAKLLDESAPGRRTTAAVARHFTPDYASPEQVRGLAVNTSADIYSLGAILYELLTEQRAHRITNATPLEWERAVCETEVVPPKLVARDLDPDLDNIVLMAMRKEPDRRYPSVDQFAEDIRRHLDARPVRARKDSLWYRSRKFARRRRYFLAAAAAIVASLVFGMAAALSEARQARAARDIAIAERQRAEERLVQVIDLSNHSLAGFYALMERLPGAMPARKELLDEMVGFLEKLSADAADDDRLKFALAKANSRLGDLQGDPDSPNIGDTAGALKSFRAASALVSPTASSDAEHLEVWADLQNKLGRVFTEMGDRATARAVLEKAIRVLEGSTALASGNALRMHAALTLTLSRATFDLPSALRLGELALKEAAEAARQSPNDDAIQLLVSVTQTQVGYAQLLMGDAQAAEGPYLESARIRERLAREHPNDLLYRRHLKLAYEHLAALEGAPDRVNLGHPALARLYYQKARPLEEADLADPRNTTAKFDYACYLVTAAAVDAEGPGESFVFLRKAAGIFESLAAAEPGIERNQHELGVTAEHIGNRLLAMRRYPEALVEFTRALALNGRILARDPTDQALLAEVLSAERGVTRALMLTGNHSGAVEHAEELVRRAETIQSAGPREASLGEAYLLLAMVHRQFSECDQATQAAKRSIDHLRLVGQSVGRAALVEAQGLVAGCGQGLSSEPEVR